MEQAADKPALTALCACCTTQSVVQVNNADALLKMSQKVLGSTITNGVVKHTFFQHFCAGTMLG